YYDITTVPADKSLAEKVYTEENHYQGGPAYGNAVHFIVPANKEYSLTAQNLGGAWDATVIVVKGTLNLTKANLKDSYTWSGDGSITTEYSGLGETFTHGKTIIIDGGTVNIDIPNFKISNTSDIINLNGTLNLNGSEIDYTNGTEKGFSNFGTIVGTNGSGINLASGCSYYNAGSIDLTDKGYIKFNGNYELVNLGHIQAYNSLKDATQSLADVAAGAQNSKIVNICDMTFEKFCGVHTYIGTSNSLLYAKEGLFTNAGARITLGSQTMVKCGDWLDNGGQVAASTAADEYAVFQVTGDVDEQTGQDTKATGYVYFDIAGAIKGMGDSAPDNYHVTNFKANMLTYTISEATAPANITIAKDEDGCNYIGYHEGEGNKTFDPNYIYYAFEDLGTTDDFDFNDVVIRVSTPNANGVSTVELMAAGGTMPTVVTYGDKTLGSEVHQTFGVEVGTMVNTGAEKKEFKTLGTIEGLSADTDMTKLPFGITVTGNGGQVTRVVNSVENNGKAPLMIVVNGDENGKWFWATERTNITAAYTQFGEWGANAGTNTDWYKNAADGKVWKW
ncbi:MAG: DUF4842 domain-containing protein, partial [Prevotella sp.]|nr:DUF4842 domain-containing protein [Prevotella sp.]